VDFQIGIVMVWKVVQQQSLITAKIRLNTTMELFLTSAAKMSVILLLQPRLRVKRKLSV
jgi:hypothetical protein